MFGIRRSNVSYKPSSDNLENDIIENSENLNHIEEEEDIYKNKKFIFYDDNKKFTNQIEIYISLTNYNNKKLLVIVGSESSIKELKNQIILNVQSFPEFKNLNGIKVEGIYKISNDSKINLPVEGKVTDYVNSGDILYCNLITDEFWIKTYFNIQTVNFKKIIKLEYKLKKKMRYKRFKLMLMKGGIQLFIDNIKSLKFYNSFNYFIKLFEFKIKKHKNIITHNIHIKQKGKTTIDKIINFSSEIVVILKFGIFEKLIHKNTKITKLKYRKNLRANEYNDLPFEELINDTKFLPEFSAIKELSEEFLKEQYNNKNPHFLFFSNKKPKYLINDFFIKKKSKSKYIDDEKPINELKDEYEDEKESKIDELNGNININEISTKRRSTLNSIKNSVTDSLDSNKMTSENENNSEEKKENKDKKRENKENKEKKKRKRRSLFFLDDKKETDIIEIPKKKKKEKKDIIKNMIIIASFIIKEEKKKENILIRQITCKDLKNNLDFRKNVPNTENSKYSVSNKVLSIYDNNNMNFSFDEKEDDKNLDLNIELYQKESNEHINFNNSEIEIDSKPKTFSDKNILKNNFLFKSFNVGEDYSKELNELFLDIHEKDEKQKEKQNVNLFNNSKYNNNIIDIDQNLFDNFDGGSSSNLEEDVINLNNEFTRKSYRRNQDRRSTYSEKKVSIFSTLRNKDPPNFYHEIKYIFDYEAFLERIKNHFSNTSTKKMFDKIKMPKSKDIEYLEKEYKFLIARKRTKQFEELKFGTGEYHIYIFMSILFIFSAMIILCLNIDLISLFY